MAFGMTLSILIPAHNEAMLIAECLTSVYTSTLPQTVAPPQIIVIANGCTDDTAQVARQHTDHAAANGWQLEVLDLPEGGKIPALRAGEAHAVGDVLVYLDADVTLDRTVMADLYQKLQGPVPLYGSGSLRISSGSSLISRLYRRYYERVPFMSYGVPGCGLFAMNRAGRARWDDWPELISDDTFARLHFAPHERIASPSTYDWPVVEGWRALVKVRRRQDAGVREIAARYPHLLSHQDRYPNTKWHHLKNALRRPLAFVVYSAVALATRLGGSTSAATRWDRGR